MVYPRVCGGTYGTQPTPPRTWGLSPRVRGNLPSTLPSANGGGSIPACAGEPGSESIAPRRPKVYPRVCGGTLSSGRPSSWTAGLSPRVRGNPGIAGKSMGGYRSIPACAGEPASGAGIRIRVQVYPRVCGGTTIIVRPALLTRGLSPRVRGNLFLSQFSPNFQRSIPACAGEPHGDSYCTFGVRVYPRVCGGTCASEPIHCNTCGLSPRVRGNLRYVALAFPLYGSIPACAGEPRGRESIDSQSAVYPRVCGGTTNISLFPRSRRGLSPRVRGNRVCL